MQQAKEAKEAKAKAAEETKLAKAKAVEEKKQEALINMDHLSFVSGSHDILNKVIQDKLQGTIQMHNDIMGTPLVKSTSDKVKWLDTSASIDEIMLRARSYFHYSCGFQKNGEPTTRKVYSQLVYQRITQARTRLEKHKDSGDLILLFREIAKNSQSYSPLAG